MLITAGGANDAIRDFYLGVPEPKSEEIYYNVVTLEKQMDLRNFGYFQPGDLFDRSTVANITTLPGRKFEPPDVNNILKMAMDEALLEDGCPAETVKKFSDGSDDHPGGIGSSLITETSETQELIAYFFGNRAQHIELGGVAVPALVQFHREMSSEIERQRLG